MEQKTVGLVSSPELPSTIAHAIKESLEEELSAYVANGELEWKVEVIVDLLTGAAENVKDILDETERLKSQYEWNFAVSLTDLPIYNGNSIVLADAEIDKCIAQVSLPSFGWRPTPKRVKNTIILMVKELYFRQHYEYEQYDLAQKGIGPLNPNRKRSFLNRLEKTFHFSSIRRIESPECIEGNSVRFIVNPKLNGLFRILFGMTIANRPWSILPAFKSVVAIAFATGAYGLIFPTLWKLSTTYEGARFIGLMLTAIIGMAIWIIFSHDLWEKKKKGEETNRLRWLYNCTTLLTLGTSVMMYYFLLFFLFLIAVSVFVPPDLFQAEAGTDIGPLNYLKLAWLVTSVATFAGAIGAGLENPERVRKSAYSYRQYTRYQEMKELERKEERGTDNS